MYNRQNVIRVDFRKGRKKLKIIIAIAALAILAVFSAFVWWFVHVNSQGDLTSLYPSEIKQSMASSKNIEVEYYDGTKVKKDVDSDIILSLDESEWTQTTLDKALDIEPDVKFNIKFGSSKCEIRLIESENVLIAKMNNYYRCYELSDKDFDTLLSAFE